LDCVQRPDDNIASFQDDVSHSKEAAINGFPRELFGAAITVGRCALEISEPLFSIADPTLELRATRERAHLRISGLGAIAAEGGTRVCIDPVSPSATAELEAWLVSTIAALLLAQQGRFALHSSVLDLHGAGIAVAGPRGAGKSTTALRLVQRGHKLIADDVAPIRPDRQLIVTPYGRPIHIKPETAEAIELDLSGAVPHPVEPKLQLPSPPFVESPLNAIVVLRPEPGVLLAATAESGAAAAAVVAENVYRAEILASIYPREIFEWAAMIAGQAKVFVLRRPEGDWTVDSVCSAIEELADRHYPRRLLV
jgi:hypothetical protein